VLLCCWLQNQTCADTEPLTPGNQAQACPPGDWVVNTNMSNYSPPSPQICCMVRLEPLCYLLLNCLASLVCGKLLAYCMHSCMQPASYIQLAVYICMHNMHCGVL
jgi:hypothetical protein